MGVLWRFARGDEGTEREGLPSPGDDIFATES